MGEFDTPDFHEIFSLYTMDCGRAEHLAHGILSKHNARTMPIGGQEWFEVSHEQAISAITNACQTISLKTSREPEQAQQNHLADEPEKITLNCPSCQQKLRVPLFAGAEVTCPACKSEFVKSPFSGVLTPVAASPKSHSAPQQAGKAAVHPALERVRAYKSQEPPKVMREPAVTAPEPRLAAESVSGLSGYLTWGVFLTVVYLVFTSGSNNDSRKAVIAKPSGVPSVAATASPIPASVTTTDPIRPAVSIKKKTPACIPLNTAREMSPEQIIYAGRDICRSSPTPVR